MTMLQIRNVPADVHRKLKARAALEGITLTEYALAELTRSLERPTRRELMERVRQRVAVDASETGVDAVRAERDAH